MKKILVMITFIVLFSSCKSSRHIVSLDNKYLLYSSVIKTEESFWTRFFYVNSSGQVAFVSSNAFGYRHQNYQDNKAVDVPPNADVYTLYRKSDFIYHIYNNGKDTIKRFSLKRNDTISFHGNYEQVNASYFSGEDTTVLFYNNPIDCWKYIEWAYIPPNYKEVIERFVDKKYFLPIYISKHRYSLRDNGDTLKQQYILRALLDVSDVKTEEWVISDRFAR